MKTGVGEDINIEMTHPELVELYNQFENIQGELDAMLALKAPDATAAGNQ